MEGQICFNYRAWVLLVILSLSGLITRASDFRGEELGSQMNSQVASLAEGDLIFQKSQSYQAPAIAEATDSPWSHVGVIVKQADKWFVAEAIQPVTVTELSRWVLRGQDKEYIVFRHKNMSSKLLPQLYAELKKYQGMNYDIYFEWSNERIYCSEFVYKVFEKVLGRGIGTIQKMKEMNLNGPRVKELIQRRLTDLGKTLNPEELILTPISQMRDPHLEMIFHFLPKKAM